MKQGPPSPTFFEGVGYLALFVHYSSMRHASPTDGKLALAQTYLYTVAVTPLPTTPPSEEARLRKRLILVRCVLMFFICWHGGAMDVCTVGGCVCACGPTIESSSRSLPRLSVIWCCVFLSCG